MSDPKPGEDVYLGAAERAADVWCPASSPAARARHVADLLVAPWFRAAVDAAHAAGYRAGRPTEETLRAAVNTLRAAAGDPLEPGRYRAWYRQALDELAEPAEAAP